MKDYLQAGKLVTTHGVRGELKAEIWCDDFDFFELFDTFYLDDKGGRSLEVRSCRPHGNMALVTFEGINDMDAARALVGRILYFNRDDVELEEGVHYIDDILGCQVIDVNTGKVYGRVTDIRQGVQDVYTIKGEEGQIYYFPAVPEFLKELDPENGRVMVAPIPGMFEDAVNGDKE